MTVWLAVGALVLGLALLVKAADAFVVAAEAVASRLGWSPTVIGAVVVGFGTSLPELAASAVAAFGGQADLAIGNAAGSNVANLLVILGLAALVAPLRGSGSGSGRDVAIAAGAGVLLVALCLDGGLGGVDGLVLVGVLLATVAWQVATGRTVASAVDLPRPVVGLAVRIVLGLAGVVLGARALVWGATELATGLGVPAIVMGSVLVAVGTSLPELATAIASARRGQTEILIGNLVGSNAFNALGVVGVAGLIGASRSDPLEVGAAALAVVVAGAVVTVVIGGWLWRLPRVGRIAGGALVCVYAASIPLLLAVG